MSIVLDNEEVLCFQNSARYGKKLLGQFRELESKLVGKKDKEKDIIIDEFANALSLDKNVVLKLLNLCKHIKNDFVK